MSYQTKLVEYEIEKIFSTHSFHSHQISVVTILDSKENTYKGIAVLPVPEEQFGESIHYGGIGGRGKPLILDSKSAKSLCRFIEKVLNEKLPAKITIESSGPDLRINLKKFVKKWHGGGGYKGRVDFGYSFFSFYSNAIVSKNSLIQLKNSLIDLFELDIKG